LGHEGGEVETPAEVPLVIQYAGALQQLAIGGTVATGRF
jgi:hypothetical protein